MNAYLVNDYYIFTDYQDLASLLHDIMHYTDHVSHNAVYTFSIMKGSLHTEQMVFINELGQTIPLSYEQEDDLYFAGVHDICS